MEKIKPKSKRNLTRRIYDDPYTLIRKLFSLSDDEMPIEFYWDKKNGDIVLLTIKD